MQLNFKQQVKQLVFVFLGLWKQILYSKQTLAFVILCFGTVTLLPAQNWDQIIKSVASDRATGDYFGISVAISGDYAIVGALLEDEDAAGGATASDAGSAYIFRWTGTIWTQEAKIVASDRAIGDNFGISVAISGDYAIVGAYFEDEDAAGGATVSNAGSAYIFKRTGTTWAQEAKIVAADRAVSDNFGWSVAISGDYAIVGAYFEDEDAAGGATATSAGSAYIFKRTGTTWAQEAKIVASDRATGDFFGFSVAISGDYAIVGAYQEDQDAAGGATLSNAGSAYIFKRTGTIWTQEAKIVAADRAVSDNFGRSVAISGDYAIVGAHLEDEDAAGGTTVSDAGSVYFYQKPVVLPIELLSFSGKTTGGGNILSWTTTSESQNKGFDIERSKDGVYFEKIGFVAGNGTTTQQQDYFFIDKIFESVTYYRLKQLDFNGEVTYSKVITIDASSSKNIFRIYPNPTVQSVTVLTDTEGVYHISDMSGQIVLTGYLTPQKVIDVSSLPAGIYVLKTATNQARFTKK